MRRSINTLQTCSSFGKDKKLTAIDIESISGIVPNKTILKVDMVLSTRGVSYSDVSKLCEDLILDGFDCQQLLSQLLDYYLTDPASNKISDIKKARMAELIAATDYQLL